MITILSKFVEVEFRTPCDVAVEVKFRTLCDVAVEVEFRTLCDVTVEVEFRTLYDVTVEVEFRKLVSEHLEIRRVVSVECADAFRGDSGEMLLKQIGGPCIVAGVLRKDDIRGPHHLQSLQRVLFQCLELPDEVILNLARHAVPVERDPMGVDVVLLHIRHVVIHHESYELVKGHVMTSDQGFYAGIGAVLPNNANSQPFLEMIVFSRELTSVSRQKTVERMANKYVFGVRVQSVFNRIH